MRLTSLAPLVATLGCVVGANALDGEARSLRASWPKVGDEPYAPSPEAARYISLGYNELGADLMWIRALGYFGGDDASARGVRDLVVAMTALDPRFESALTWGSIAMQSITMKLDQRDYLEIVAVLERGMKEFPKNYNLPLRAGEIYVRNLKSDDPSQQRAWKQTGTVLLSRAVRLPDAPKDLGTYVAHLETELGQREQAIRDLRELITYTTKPSDRNKLVKKLALLTNTPSEGIAYELDVERTRFDAAWKRERPELSPTMFVVMGPRLLPYFDLGDLAIDHELDLEPIEALPPLPDDANGEAPLPLR